MAQLTLNLPDSLVEHVSYLGQATHRDAEAMLVDTLEMMWPAWKGMLNRDIFPPMKSLSEAEVLELASLKMDPLQNERLGDLQARGKITELTAKEQFELLMLIHIYQIGLLRKSESLAEAVRRDLRKPLS
ncbi:hypothetical protein QUF90_03765 [Desulfococcaceae bacterium HSG9]|nr:hypothetical protein [Desulfococcaceae bacterium HSG9]